MVPHGVSWTSQRFRNGSARRGQGLQIFMRGPQRWELRRFAVLDVARDLIAYEVETGMRVFPRGIVPDRLPGKAKPKAPSSRGRRSPGAASPKVKGRRPQGSLVQAGA